MLDKIGSHISRIYIGNSKTSLLFHCQDPFPPARMAAVLALAATQQFYTIMEIANRVLPAVTPLSCDPEKQVRN